MSLEQPPTIEPIKSTEKPEEKAIKQETISPEEKKALEKEIDDISNENPELGQIATKGLDNVKSMNIEDRKNFLEGWSNIGYKTTEIKSKVLGSAMAQLSKATKGNKFLHTFFNKYTGIYNKAGERAKKEQETIGKGKISRLSGMGQGMGNVFKYGRIIYDLVGSHSMRGLNPFRHVTAAAMFVGRTAEAAKETRFEYEGAKEKTRVKDIDRAMDEAWGVYDKAFAEKNSDEVTAEDLEKAYKDNLPKDVQDRLNRMDFAGTKFCEKILHKDIKWAADRLMKKIDQIESDSNLKPKEKEAKRQELLKRNEDFINELDSMVGDQGVIDNISYFSRLTEKTSKTVANVLIIDSVHRFAKLGWNMRHLLEHLGPGEAGVTNIPVDQQAPLPDAEVEANEKDKIANYAETQRRLRQMTPEERTRHAERIKGKLGERRLENLSAVTQAKSETTDVQQSIKQEKAPEGEVKTEVAGTESKGEVEAPKITAEEIEESKNYVAFLEKGDISNKAIKERADDIFAQKKWQEFSKRYPNKKDFWPVRSNVKVDIRKMAIGLEKLEQAKGSGDVQEVRKLIIGLKGMEQDLEKQYGIDLKLPEEIKIPAVEVAAEVKISQPETVSTETQQQTVKLEGVPSSAAKSPEAPVKGAAHIKEESEKTVAEQEAKRKVLEKVAAKVAGQEAAMQKHLEYQGGKSVWQECEKQLEKRFEKMFSALDQGDAKTAEALKTYDIDRFKDIIVNNPEKYGLPKDVDFTKLSAEELKNIDWDRAFKESFPDNNPVSGLTEKQVDDIFANNEKLRSFFAEHPDAPRTVENYEAVLKDEEIIRADEASKEAAAAEVGKPETELGTKTEEISKETRGKLAKILGRVGITPDDVEKINKIINLEDEIQDKEIPQLKFLAEHYNELISNTEKAKDIFQLSSSVGAEYEDIYKYYDSTISNFRDKPEIMKGVAGLLVGPNKQKALSDIFGTDVNSSNLSRETAGEVEKYTVEFTGEDGLKSKIMIHVKDGEIKVGLNEEYKNKISSSHRKFRDRIKIKSWGMEGFWKREPKNILSLKSLNEIKSKIIGSAKEVLGSGEHSEVEPEIDIPT